MDGINPINGPQGIPSRLEQDPNQVRNQETQGKQPPPPPFNVKLTEIGKLFSAIGESDKYAQNELKQTMDTFLKEVQKTDFDLDAFLENISGEIKNLANQAGIDLRSALSQVAEKGQRPNGQITHGPHPGGRPPQGPPPPPPNDVYDTDNSEYSQEFDLRKSL